jgi:hypothetical protein
MFDDGRAGRRPPSLFRPTSWQRSAAESRRSAAGVCLCTVFRVVLGSPLTSPPLAAARARRPAMNVHTRSACVSGWVGERVQECTHCVVVEGALNPGGRPVDPLRRRSDTGRHKGIKEGPLTVPVTCLAVCVPLRALHGRAAAARPTGVRRALPVRTAPVYAVRRQGSHAGTRRGGTKTGASRRQRQHLAQGDEVPTDQETHAEWRRARPTPV